MAISSGRYVEEKKLVGGKFYDPDILVRSTAKQRTLMSAYVGDFDDQGVGWNHGDDDGWGVEFYEWVLPSHGK